MAEAPRRAPGHLPDSAWRNERVEVANWHRLIGNSIRRQNRAASVDAGVQATSHVKLVERQRRRALDGHEDGLVGTNDHSWRKNA